MNADTLEIRRDILSIAHSSGHGHIPTCFSVVDLLWAVYNYMRHDPKRPNWPQRDYFVLSKGHASLAHYCTLAHLGYFPPDSVTSFGLFKSIFGCHGDRHKVPGIEASTGSLGHGIGLATGMALGHRIRKQPNRVFTIIGDGEANEGSVWEALLVASHQKLQNLTIIYDDNRSHSRGLQIENPAEKLAAFGCQVHSVNGHDISEITRALEQPQTTVKAIVAQTIKGSGSQTLAADVYAWHRRSPTKPEFDLLMEELNAQTV